MAVMRRALLVEDDVLIGMMVADMLAELGYQVVGPMRRLAAGLAAVAEESFDVAVLDVNLAGEESFPIADALEARQIPYLFATGYGPGSEELARRDRPVLTKPFSAKTLAAGLRALG
jgi:DNA-binding response OmpR family regulator